MSKPDSQKNLDLFLMLAYILIIKASNNKCIVFSVILASFVHVPNGGV